MNINDILINYKCIICDSKFVHSKFVHSKFVHNNLNQLHYYDYNCSSCCTVIKCENEKIAIKLFIDVNNDIYQVITNIIGPEIFTVIYDLNLENHLIHTINNFNLLEQNENKIIKTIKTIKMLL